MRTRSTRSQVSLQRLGSISQRGLESLLRRVGGTPLVAVDLLTPEPRSVLLKVEGANPSGSLKDRTALKVLHDLRSKGALGPGVTLVDSTSGNFGIAMAWMCRAVGCRFVAVSDPHLTRESHEAMEALGTRVEIVRRRDATGSYLGPRLERAKELAAAIPDATWTDQYANPANPRSHFEMTGPELLRQVPGPLDVVFVPASTGGTLAGLAAYLRRHSPRTRIVAVDGEGSALFGGTPGPRTVNGLGASRASPFLTSASYHEVIRVGAEAAFHYCLDLADRAGLEVGGSSGAAVAACARYLAAHPEPLTAVCICPDDGAKYLSTIFDLDWLRSRGIPRPGRRLVGDEVRAIGAATSRREDRARLTLLGT